jgi:glycogen debranching enzyme
VAQALCALGRVERPSDLGTKGPLDASGASGSLFKCLFGRDSIRMARDLLEAYPAVARATLLTLAELQGVRDEPRTEEEPGRILHEYRSPEDTIGQVLLRTWSMPSFPYYGSVDATPDFVNLLAEYCTAEGTAFLETRMVDRTETPTTMRAVLLRAMTWITERLDAPSAHGLLWARSSNPHAATVQTWEDSHDSMYFEDGTLIDVSWPFAHVGLQGYTFDALLNAAELVDNSELAADWRSRAERLRAQTLRLLWDDELGTFCLGASIPPDGSPCRARAVSSAPGHLLASRLLDGDDAERYRTALARRFRQPDMLAAAGIRTKSTGAPRFGPGTYHNGSTWPMDTGIFADGLRRHGFHAQADDLDDRVLRACAVVDGFPEFLRGDTDDEIRVNTQVTEAVLEEGVEVPREQPPQDPQGWTVTRVSRILRRRAG